MTTPVGDFEEIPAACAASATWSQRRSPASAEKRAVARADFDLSREDRDPAFPVRIRFDSELRSEVDHVAGISVDCESFAAFAHVRIEPTRLEP